MNAFEIIIFVLGILAFVFGTVRYAHRFPHPGASSSLGNTNDTRLLVEEVARLRDRVQVLERVITDNHGSIDLDRRIEQLRDR